MGTYQPTCSRKLRNELIKRFPNVESNSAYLRMLYYLLFPSEIEQDTNNTIIDQTILARIEGKEAMLRHRHYCGKDFLNAFQRDVLPDFVYSGWSAKKGEARVVISTGLPADAEDLAKIQYDSVRRGYTDQVRVDTGKAFDKVTQSKHRQAILNLAETLARKHESSYKNNKKIVDYHNNRSVQTFSKKIKANLDAAFSVIDALPEAIKKKHAKAQLMHIIDQPKPFIAPVAKSDRAYSIGASLATVKGDVRKALTKGWYEYDLKAAQVAVIAEVWDIPELKDFLRKRTSLWEYLADGIGEEVTAVKKPLKTAIYSVAYGAWDGTIAEKLAQDISPKAANDFFSIPLIQVIFKAREKRFELLRQQGSLTTIFGNRIETRNDEEIRSALAREAQAVEVALMLPIYDLAKTTDNFQVVVYSFDGVTISFEHPNLVRTWDRKIKEAVQVRADDLRMLTYLDDAVRL